MLQLFVVALVWGTVGTTSRLLFAMEHPPNAFLLVALANITGFVFLGVRQMGPKGFSGLTIDHHGLMGGLETGFWYHTSILMLYAGLERTSATHEAFIAQLCTLMVPALQAFQGEKELGSFGLFLLWNGSVVKGLASLWHAEAYKNVSPSKAEVVLATTPLWALGLAVLFLAEPVGGQTVVGATLFMAALFLAASPPSEEGPDANGVLAPPSDSSSDDVGTATLVEA